MNVEQLIIELRKDGYSAQEVLDFLKNMYNLELTPYHVTMPLYVDVKRQEFQCTGRRRWHQAFSKLPKSVLFEKHYDKKFNVFRVSEIEKMYNLNYQEYRMYIRMAREMRDVDFFPMHIKNQIHEADDYTCRMCKILCINNKNFLETHHVIPAGGDHFENGVSLCYVCHKTIHRRYTPIMGFYDRSTFDQLLKDLFLHESNLIKFKRYKKRIKKIKNLSKPKFKKRKKIV